MGTHTTRTEYPKSPKDIQAATDEATQALREIFGLERIEAIVRVRERSTKEGDPFAPKELHHVNVQFDAMVPGPGMERDIEAEEARKAAEEEAKAQAQADSDAAEAAAAEAA